MDLRERMADAFGAFVKRLQQHPRRNQGAGKHRAGRQSGHDARAKLLAGRKRERQARRYARLCSSGNKNRARRTE